MRTNTIETQVIQTSCMNRTILASEIEKNVWALADGRFSTTTIIVKFPTNIYNPLDHYVLAVDCPRLPPSTTEGLAVIPGEAPFQPHVALVFCTQPSSFSHFLRILNSCIKKEKCSFVQMW